MLQVERVVLDQVHPQHSSSRVFKVVEPECGVAEILVARMALHGAHARQMCAAEYTHSRYIRGTCIAHMHTTHRVASDVYHDARPVVCPELTQVPEEDVLGREVPLLNEGLLNAGGSWQRVKVEVIVAKLEPSAHLRFRAAVRKAGRKDAVGQSGTVR